MKIMNPFEGFTLDAGKEMGCLLVHGFAGCPGEIREMGERMAEKGITVEAPLLPGHEGKVEDLARATARSWQETVEASYRALAGRVDKVILLGFSMGGSLSIMLAAESPLLCLILVSTPVFFSKYLEILYEIGGRFLPFAVSTQKDFSSEDEKSRLRLVPMKAVGELFKIVQDARKKVSKIEHPTIVIHSKNDRVVSAKNCHCIFDCLSSPIKEKLILEKSGHEVMLEGEKEIVFENILRFIDGVHEKI